MANSIYNTAKTTSLLAQRYQAPTYAFFPQVPDGTGGNKVRTADAIAMFLWPSRGLELHGFEIKTSRADWLKELKDPSKAESICQYCDRWWIVIGDKEIVKDGELPPTWGLLVPRGDSLVAKMEAPLLQAVPITREFLAGLLRRAADWSKASETRDAELLVEYEKGVKYGEKKQAQDLEVQKQLVDKFKNMVVQFQEASGVQIDRWNAGRIGKAVQLVLDNETERERGRLERLYQTAQQIVEDIKNALEENAKNEDQN